MGIREPVYTKKALTWYKVETKTIKGSSAGVPNPKTVFECKSLENIDENQQSYLICVQGNEVFTGNKEIESFASVATNCILLGLE